MTGVSRSLAHWLLLVVIATFAAGCPGSKPPKVAPKPAPKAEKKAEPVVWRMSKSGVGFRLSDADPVPPPRPAAAKAKALGKKATEKVLKRLPRFTRPPQEKKFAMRAKSIKAPRPGRTIKTLFPPPDQLRPAAPPVEPSARGPLKILRYAPEGGKVDIAPRLSVTFSKPMVDISSHAEIAKQKRPLTLTPEPKGQWRWIGTQTVLFEPEERFPMATDYRVEIAEGARSVTGEALAEGKRWTFSLPPLRMTGFHPNRWGEASDLDAVIFAQFNQRIDRKALLAHLDVTVKGESRPIRLATEDEIELDKRVRSMSKRAPKDQWIAIRAVEPLPKASSIVTIVKRGAPSAEGPKRTEGEQSRTFRTYGPMRLERSDCWWSDECPPLAPWSLRFSNPIDRSTFQKGMVTIEPALPGARIEVSGNAITIRGRSKGRTTYTVTVAGSLGDKFEQTLGEPAVARFKVTPAKPVLFAEQRSMMVLDPQFEPKLSVYSVNRPALRVRLFRVQPKDFKRYLEFRRDWDHDRKLTKPPGRQVLTKVVRPRKARDELVETQIDLGRALKDGFGQVLAIVEPTTPPKRDRWGGIHREWVRAWLQVTNLGLQVFADDDDLYGWASTLKDGAPIEGVTVGLLGTPAQAKTGANGIAKTSLPGTGGMLYGKKDSDLVILPVNDSYYYSESIRRRSVSDRLQWFVFDDRKLYKPGEKVNAKGWIRVGGMGKGGDVSLPPALRRNSVRYKVYDPRGAELTKGETPVDETGGFHLSFPLPKNANLGSARIDLEVARSVNAVGRHSHRFQIEEFRRPEYEVTAQVSEGPHSVGRHAIATVTASYFAGGGLVDAEVDWKVWAAGAHFVPPNRGSFHFGKPRTFRWWGAPEKSPDPESWAARTAAGGAHRLRIDFDALDPAYPRELSLEATVTDVNRQSWTAKSKILVHPADVSVGLRKPGSYVRAGQNINLDVIVADLEGNLVAGRVVKLRSARIESEWLGDEYEEKEVDVETCELESTDAIGKCGFPTKSSGLHRVTAVVTDRWGRMSHTSMKLYVLGSDSAENPMVKQGRVEVLADQEEYRGGDTAELLVMAPFAPAEGVLTLRRQGVVELKRFRMEQTTMVVPVRIDGGYVPNVTARVDLVGAKVRENEVGDPDASLPKRPAFATGQTALKVPPVDRTLEIKVTPRRRFLKPGSSTSIAFDVRDATGKAVPSRLAVVVVDEAVLALAGYDLPDPLEIFYADRGARVRDFETRFRVALMRPDTARMRIEAEEQNQKKDGTIGHGAGIGTGQGFGAGGFGLSANKSAEGARRVRGPKGRAAPAPPMAQPATVSLDAAEAGAADDDAGGKPIEVRTNFSALAAFRPNVKTDAKGHATVRIKIPDNLTRYRIMAVAASGENQFGSVEDSLTARLPLMVRPSLPRFLNYGDRFELPVLLQNQTSKALRVDVAARVANARLLGARGLRVTVPANDRVEVRFPAAARKPGTARFQIGGVSRAGTDAAEKEIPVWTPATTEAFATYGTVDRGAVAQRVKAPSDAVPDWGGLEITTSSTALQGLTDAVVYLVRYPFECNEQISSRVLALAALRDVLKAFEAKGLPPTKALIASVAKDMKKLKQRQHYTGGWDWWRRDRRPTPYVSIHVTHALTRAKDKGFKVPPDMLRNALRFLRDIRRHIPSWYPESVKRVLESYAIYVRHRAGQDTVSAANDVITRAGGVKKLPLEAVGWLWPSIAKDGASVERRDAIRRHVNQRITETAGKAHFVTRYAEGEHLILHSSRRVDGILLESMIGDQPESDVIPKIVKGLLAHRKRGRWYNTQENAWVLVALDRYFNTYEKVTPNFIARAWLGSQFAAEHRFRGRSTDYQRVDIPMSFVKKLKGSTPLTLSKDGPGRLYYRMGMQYAPKSLKLPPADHGFAVAREYEAATDEDKVRRDKNGVWRVKAGSMVRVRLKMVARSRRYHVALVDPIPAGFEPMNAALATTGTVPRDPKPTKGGSPWWWSRPWYEHQNMRDERIEAFTSLLWSGVYDYTYVARATTPGNFVVPPTKAEEMYDPETFGRSGSDRVIVY